MNKKRLLLLVALIVVALSYWLIQGKAASNDAELLANVNHGNFYIEITTTGELEAKNSVKIMGPSAIRSAGIWQVKIENMVEEGKVVKKGDFVASLDKSELMGKMQNLQTELEKMNSQYSQTQLDTTLQMRQSRDELINLKYAVEEKALILEQSRFEPPATIKQAQIEVDKSSRAYQQALENYKIKNEQSKAKMQEVGANLGKAKRELENMNKMFAEFEIQAPEDGMVIYVRDWDGNRVSAGSTINVWEPTVASLPDLSIMISKTYVNEVDIRKIKEGQSVRIGLDAFPEKKLTGKVTRVANVGEQKPNSDAKVFEVVIEVNEEDTSLRPAMTTSNTIIAEVINDANFIPLECLHSQGDSLSFVYKKEGLSVTKQQVLVGKTNNNEAVVLDGLKKGDQVFLTNPKGSEKLTLKTLDQVASSVQK